MDSLETDGPTGAGGIEYAGGAWLAPHVGPDRHERVREHLAAAREMRRVDYDRLLEQAEAAFELACLRDDAGRVDETGMAEALNLLAHRSCVAGDSVAALSQAGQALALVDSEEPSQIVAELYDSMGWAHFTLGDYAESLDLLLRSLRMAEEIGDRSLQAFVMDSMGNVNSASGHPREALGLQEVALGIHREMGNLVGEATVLNNLAYTCMDLGDPDTALACAKLALDFCEREGRSFLLAGVLDTLADVHLWLGDLDTAEKYAREGLELALEKGWHADETNALIVLGRVAFERGELRGASAFTRSALALAEKAERVVEQYRCHKLLSTIEERLGEFEKSLSHFKRYHELERAKVNGETESRLAHLRVEYQVASAKKDGEILRLRSLALEREVEERKLAQARLEAQASLDPLTGLFNRGHLPVIEDKLKTAALEGSAVSLMLIDVDHFKQVNDTFGHLAGDRVLMSIARELTDSMRGNDTPCRYGGDEFLVMLTGIDRLAAARTAERIRSNVAASPVHGRDEDVRITVSMGIATLSHAGDTSLEGLIERADKALYAAKQAGRNCVVVDPE